MADRVVQARTMARAAHSAEVRGVLGQYADDVGQLLAEGTTPHARQDDVDALKAIVVERQRLLDEALQEVGTLRSQLAERDDEHFGPTPR
jgi:hypothetical protein